MAAQTYTLGGFEVYDVDGVPHYSSTKTILKRDKTGKPISPYYDLGGVSVYDVDGVPHYKETGEKLQHGEQGKPVAPKTTPPVSEAGAEDGTVRTNSNGITQKGMNLGGIQNFIKFNADLKIADGADFFNFNSTKSPDAYKGGDNTISTKDTGYTVPKASAPIVGADTVKGGDLKIDTGKSGGYTIPPASVPGTTGHSPKDPQSGVSDAPDNADQTRALGMKPFRGSARQQEFANRPGNRPPVSEASVLKPTGGDKARKTYGRAFLDSTSKGPMGVLRDASASIGVIRTNDGKISIKDGDGYRTYTGDASAREVAFDLGGGQKGYDKHAAGFKKIVPEKPADTSTDDEQTPATIQDISQMDVTTPEWKNQGQAFADHYKKQLKEGNK